MNYSVISSVQRGRCRFCIIQTGGTLEYPSLAEQFPSAFATA
jgi:hypothetical protein